MMTDDSLNQIAETLSSVEARIDQVLKESHRAQPAIEHLVKSGGKRVRPLMTILSAGLIAESLGNRIPESVIPVAAASELIHTASLLHDDVIDESDLRRGRPTSRVIYSNSVSVLAGDHCLASAVRLIHSVDTGAILADSLVMIQELTNGELIQLDIEGALDTTQQLYEKICYQKTAALFLWAIQSGARLAGGSDKEVELLGSMARNMGIAFQIADDLLDFTAGDDWGKNLMDDVRDGRLTLPMILALRDDSELSHLLKDIFSARDSIADDDLKKVRKHVVESGAVDEVQKRVDQLTESALDALNQLPSNAYRDLILQRIQSLALRKK